LYQHVERPDGSLFRTGLFALRTRRLGTVAELLIQKLLGASKGRSQFHDLYDDRQRHRIEVKFATVNTSNSAPITVSNLVSAIKEAGTDRAVPFEEWSDYEFDCNIQQIKPSEFDILYYGLFFADHIVIFRADKGSIIADDAVKFSDRQHKGNVGEGQFHINNQTLNHHLHRYLYKVMDYDSFLDLIDGVANPGESFHGDFRKASLNQLFE
jgi:hypothetical protein